MSGVGDLHCFDAFALIALGYNSQGRVSRLTSSNVDGRANGFIYTFSFIIQSEKYKKRYYKTNISKKKKTKRTWKKQYSYVFMPNVNMIWLW